MLVTQFKLSAIASAPADTPTADQTEQCLVGSVKLTGGLISGDVQLQLPKAFVAKANRRAARTKMWRASQTKTPADIAGELCNMLAGRIAASLTAAGYSSIFEHPHSRSRSPAQFECSGCQNMLDQLDLRGTFAESCVAVQLQVEMSPKILSVDDSKAVRKLLARMFRPFDCELGEAANGEGRSGGGRKGNAGPDHSRLQHARDGRRQQPEGCGKTPT